jgi:hypothetical protein
MNIFIGLCLLGVGFWIAYLRKRKQFNRTNQYGVQEFKSFEHSVGAHFGGILTGLLAGIFIFSGLGFLLAGMFIK